MSERCLNAGERAALWFRLKGWSLGEASRRTGMHKQKLWRILSGRQEPKTSDIDVIAEALGVTTPEFYGGISDKPIEAVG